MQCIYAILVLVLVECDTPWVSMKKYPGTIIAYTLPLVINQNLFTWYIWMHPLQSGECSKLVLIREILDLHSDISSVMHALAPHPSYCAFVVKLVLHWSSFPEGWLALSWVHFPWNRKRHIDGCYISLEGHNCLVLEERICWGRCLLCQGVWVKSGSSYFDRIVIVCMHLITPSRNAMQKSFHSKLTINPPWWM